MESRRTKRWSVLVMALGLLAASCGNDGAAPADEGEAGASLEERSLTFAYGNVTDAAPVFKVVGDFIERDGQEVGIEILRYDNNLDGATALRNARLMVQQNPDLILNWTGAEDVGPAVGRIYEQAEIACIAVVQTIPGCPLFDLSDADLGIDAAEIVIPIMEERGWTGNDTTVILVAAPGTGEKVNRNSRNFYSKISEAFPEMEDAAPDDITDDTTTIGELPSGIQVNGQAALEPSLTEVRRALRTVPEDRNVVLFTINDDSAFGAWRAVEQDGREDNALIVSQGASPEGLKQLRTNPSWVAEGTVFFETWPAYLLAMGVAVLDGAEPPPVTRAPQVTLSKETVDDFYEGDEPKSLPPLPPENEYLNDYSDLLERLTP